MGSLHSLQWTGVDNAIWAAFEDRAAALIHIKNTGLESGFALKPKPDNISAAGIDHAAVLNAASEAVRKYHEDGDLLELAESYLQSVVRAMMLVFNKSFDEVVF